MLFFPAAMCRRAINARLTNPCPGHLGVTRVHARGSARRVFALSLSVYAAAGGREAQRGQTSKYAAARGAYISLGGASGGWKRPGPPASRRPSAEPRRDMQTPERAEPRAARGALGLRPQSAAPDRQPRRRGADSGYGASASWALPPRAAPAPPSGPAPRAPAGSPRGCCRPPGSALTSHARALCSPRRLPGFWRPWADARGGEEAAAAPSPDAEAVSEPRGAAPPRAADGRPGPVGWPGGGGTRA